MNEDVLTTRYNVMNISSLEEFVNIKGGVNNNSKDVYFVRMAGTNPTLLSDIGRMDRVLTERMSAGQGRYKRINTLPGLVSVETVEYYAKCYDTWTAGGRREVIIKANGGNREWQQVLGKACNEAVRLLGKITPNMSESMEKNFVVKLLYWYEEIGKDFIKEWSVRSSDKFVISDVMKKQEYLFCHFLTLTGVDVLLLQCRGDIDEQMEGLALSKKIILGTFNACAIPEYSASKYNLAAQNEYRGSFAENVTANANGSAHSQTVLPHRNAVISMNDIRRPDRDRRTQEQLRQQEQIRQETERRNQERARQERAGQDNARQANVRQEPAGNYMRRGEGNMGQRPGNERRELEFEELALLASSVVMIAIHDRTGEVVGTGSGIMIGRDGYILTNNHVASGGMYYSVKIEDDDTIYKTEEVIKYNPVLDLAVIRIQRRLQPIPVYRGGKKLVRGQKVVAIGSPLGMFNSVSDGIISGFRNIDNVDMIQFTAPTSHGSSGGAVLNMYGEVIGISTAGMDRGQNINLAVGYECINNFIRGFV